MNKSFLIISSVISLSLACTNMAGEELNIKPWEKKVFNRLDTDNNSYLDLAEVIASTKPWMDKLELDEAKRNKMNKNKFKNYDLNKDNQVSLEEHVTGNRKEKARKKNKKSN